MSNPQHEPTMEEILASIRKIISEDAPGRPAPAAEAAPPPPPAPVHARRAGTDPGSRSRRRAGPRADAARARRRPPVEDMVFETVGARAARRARPHGMTTFSPTIPARRWKIPSPPFPKSRNRRPRPRRAAPIAPVDGSSVETVFERAVRESFEPVLQKYLSDNSAAVIERMKPLIREWMDEHFPALLEGAVRAEVERVVKARGAKR